MEIVVLLGAPGSGKGTVASRLVERLAARHVASGDLLRAAIRDGSTAGRAADAYMRRGELVPDRMVGDVVVEQLAAHAASGARLLLLDGFPRAVAQAELLASELPRLGSFVRKAVLLDVDPNVLVARLSGRRVCRTCAASFHLAHHPPRQAGRCDACGGELEQRPDDQPDTIRRRLSVYQEQTAPLIAWYAGHDLLTTVSGEGGMADVAERVAGAIEA